MKLPSVIFSLAMLPLALHAQQAPQASATTAQPRLLCLFLDLGSMEPADQVKARDAAIEFVQTKLASSDSVALMTYTSQLEVLQDFTTSRESVVAALRTALPNGTASRNNDYGARLQALQTVASTLSRLPDKKVMIYISGGVKTGIDDLTQMESAVNALIKANVVMYPLDARGLLSSSGIK